MRDFQEDYQYTDFDGSTHFPAKPSCRHEWETHFAIDVFGEDHHWKECRLCKVKDQIGE